jgi:murein DD-endopeptidase MepM/ murein hydrolase activator NlpD
MKEPDYPVAKPANALAIVSEYGSWLATGGSRRAQIHNGIDILGPIGYPVIVAADGIVVRNDRIPKYGNRLVIDHGRNDDGQIISAIYLHNDRNLVNEGDHVNRGQKIAEIGQCEDCRTPHLHFAVWIGKPFSMNWAHSNPHEFWIGGPYNIVCFDNSVDFPKDHVRFTYPVECKLKFLDMG